jgi:sterol O-acyltransferase
MFMHIVKIFVNNSYLKWLLHKLQVIFSSLFSLSPQVRLMMKTHAFVRSNVPRALAYKPHQSEDSQEMTPCPGFSKFLYFLFVPTLIYKDNYPR